MSQVLGLGNPYSIAQSLGGSGGIPLAGSSTLLLQSLDGAVQLDAVLVTQTCGSFAELGSLATQGSSLGLLERSDLFGVFVLVLAKGTACGAGLGEMLQFHEEHLAGVGSLERGNGSLVGSGLLATCMRKLVLEHIDAVTQCKLDAVEVRTLAGAFASGQGVQMLYPSHHLVAESCDLAAVLGPETTSVSAGGAQLSVDLAHVLGACLADTSQLGCSDALLVCKAPGEGSAVLASLSFQLLGVGRLLESNLPAVSSCGSRHSLAVLAVSCGQLLCMLELQSPDSQLMGSILTSQRVQAYGGEMRMATLGSLGGADLSMQSALGSSVGMTCPECGNAGTVSGSGGGRLGRCDLPTEGSFLPVVMRTLVAECGGSSGSSRTLGRSVCTFCVGETAQSSGVPGLGSSVFVTQLIDFALFGLVPPLLSSQQPMQTLDNLSPWFDAASLAVSSPSSVTQGASVMEVASLAYGVAKQNKARPLDRDINTHNNQPYQVWCSARCS